MSEARAWLAKDMIGYINTMLEYYLHIDPKALSDEEWAFKFAALKKIREEESKQTTTPKAPKS